MTDFGIRNGGVCVYLEDDKLTIVLTDDVNARDSLVATSTAQLKDYFSKVLQPGRQIQRIKLELCARTLEEATAQNPQSFVELCRVLVELANSYQVHKFSLYADNNSGWNTGETMALFTSNIGPHLPASVTDLEFNGQYNMEDDWIYSVPELEIAHFRPAITQCVKIHLGHLRVDISELANLLKRNHASLEILQLDMLLPMDPSPESRRNGRRILKSVLRKLKTGPRKSLVVKQLPRDPESHHRDSAIVFRTTSWIMFVPHDD